MLKVLVIDDEVFVRKGIVMETDWASLDCMVAGEAANGLEGLEACRKYNPDLIISDIRMPKMDGLSLLQTIRYRGLGAEVLLVSGYTDFEIGRAVV